MSNNSEKIENSAAETLDESTITLHEVIAEEQELEADADAVLGASDPKNCTYIQGYVNRQALYACATCTPPDCEPAGICLACSYACHEDHDLYELYTKRNFRCDCGNSKFPQITCRLWEKKQPHNADNKYNQNFRGVYCTCHRPYPDPEDSIKDEMIQCIVCEDWYHLRHIGLDPSKEKCEDFYEITCSTCLDRLEFLKYYYANLTKILPEEATTPGRSNRISTGSTAGCSPVTKKSDAGQNGVETVPNEDNVNNCAPVNGDNENRNTAEVNKRPSDADDDAQPDAKRRRTEEVDVIGDAGNMEHKPEVGLPTETTSNSDNTNAQNDCALSSGDTKGDKPEAASDNCMDIGTDSAIKDVPTACIYAAIKPTDTTNSEKASTCAKWPQGWREALCKCDTCKEMYARLECSFLIDLEDTVHAYEARGKGKSGEGEEERAMRALNRMDRVKAIEAIHGYNNMKTELMDYLKTFAESNTVVREEDIRNFFSQLKAKRNESR